MPTLYRVVPYLRSARAGKPGHPLYVPTSTGANRADNPESYNPLYVGDTDTCAVAEAFGWAPRWSAGLLRGTPSLPGSVRALVTYHLPDHIPICNLDDARRLVDLELRPSHVVTRNRAVTQRWAQYVYDLEQYVGVRWWSYYNPDWGSLALWDLTELTVQAVEPISVDSHAFAAAAAEIGRVID